MEINTTVALFAAQIISSLGLFWAVTSSFHKEINEVKKEINQVESKLSKEINEVEAKMNAKFDILAKEIYEVKVEQAKQGGEIHRLADKVDYLNQRIDFVYSLLPIPKLAIQVPQD